MRPVKVDEGELQAIVLLDMMSLVDKARACGLTREQWIGAWDATVKTSEESERLNREGPDCCAADPLRSMFHSNHIRSRE